MSKPDVPSVVRKLMQRGLWYKGPKAFPKLYNAHRQVEVSRGLSPKQLYYYKKDPLSEEWRTQVSQDVVDFVDEVELDKEGKRSNELLPSEKYRLLGNPSLYFSRPHNVPESTRKQVYLPNFALTLLRTPHLGPRYAQFKVPLWFSKLDLKSYLKNLYNVDVNHIRSFVIHRKATTKRPATRYQRGMGVQPTYRKKMTVELVEPFVWPAEPTEQTLNDDQYNSQQYWKSNMAGIKASQAREAIFNSEPNVQHRRSIAQQAKALLAGKEKWSPTWQQLPTDVKVLQGGRKAAALSPPPSNEPLLRPRAR